MTDIQVSELDRIRSQWMRSRAEKILSTRLYIRSHGADSVYLEEFIMLRCDVVNSNTRQDTRVGYSVSFHQIDWYYPSSLNPIPMTFIDS